MDRRNNWKEELGKAAQLRAARRQELIVEKDLLSQRLQNLTIEERKSQLYNQLKREQAEIVAQLATL